MLVVLIAALTACQGEFTTSENGISSSQAASNSHDETTPAATGVTQPSVSDDIFVSLDGDDLDDSTEGDDIVYIALDGNSVISESANVVIAGSTVTIKSAGVYSLSGKLNDGQIRIEAQNEDVVRLILNNVDINCSSNSPIYVINADKVVITLAEGTDNTLTDGSSYIFEDTDSDEPNAAVFSHDDLTINGSGALTVKANYNNGIQSKDDLKIVSGIIRVTSINDAIKGRNSIVIADGNITLKAGGDGLQSNNDVDSTQGYILIEGGTFDITAGLDGIQAETSLVIRNGNIFISSGGGSSNSSNNIGSSGNTWGKWRGPASGVTTLSDNTSTTAKGLKAQSGIYISGGYIEVDSSDDSIHSNNSIFISGGEMTLTSGDDGVHADSTIEINGGEIDITRSYEGIESAVITINNGTLHIVSSDDGINVAGGTDGSAAFGRPGKENFADTGNYCLYINGGYIYIEANGDGLDSNGSIVMTDGTVIVNGPTSSGNGALDHMGFKISGGLLIAVGSAGMSQGPSTASTQYSIMYNLSALQSAGTLIHIETGSGEEILTFAPAKSYQSVVISSPSLKKNLTCVIYSGGNSTGAITDGLYSGGAYTGGAQLSSVTLSEVVTTLGGSTRLR
jgi:hypothetical protein